MNFYGELLDTVFQKLTGSPWPKILSLIPNLNDVENTNALDARSLSLELSESSFPSNADRNVLSNDEAFVANAIEQIRHTDAEGLFAFPPSKGRRRMSAEFREQFDRLGISEAVASCIDFQFGQTEGFELFQDVKRNGISAMVCLTNPLFVSSLRNGRWRQEFFPEHSALVIEHEHEMSEMFTGQERQFPLRFCTVAFSKTPGPIRFFRIDDEALSSGKQKVLSDLARLIEQPAGNTQFGYVHTLGIHDRYPTSFDFYSEETKQLRRDVKQLGEKVSLQEIADVLIGFRPLHPDRDSDIKSTTGFLAISGREITSDGRVDLSNIRKHERPAQVRGYLEEGDFCIQSFYQSDRGFNVGVFEGDGRQITWGQNVIVVRPHASLLPEQRQVLLSFLRSPLAQRMGQVKQLASSRNGILRVTPFMLRDFPVPVADTEVVSAMGQLGNAREAFLRWIADIDHALNAIVQESTAAVSRMRILDSGQLARQRFRAGTQVESIDFRIRTQYPHPISYLWREVQVSGPDKVHRLRAIKKAAEGHTCFVAQLGILLGRITGKSIQYLTSLATRLEDRKSGLSFGDWFSIIKEVTESRAYRDLPSDVPFSELSTLTTKTGWESSARFLMDLRNDDDHHKISSHSEWETILAEAESALETIFKSTEFLTDYRYMWITETKFDSILQLNQFQYRDLSGDNPLAPLHKDSSDRHDLETDSLYMRDRLGHLHLLRPLLNYLECPECHQMSTFVFDSRDSGSEDSVNIKSLERNSIRQASFAPEFRHVGLLNRSANP